MAASEHGIGRFFHQTVIVAGLVAALLGAAYAGLSWRAALERQHWFAELEQADAKTLRRVWQRADHYGPAAWQAAAKLAASSDPAVAAEASSLLLDWVDDRQPLGAQEYQQRLGAVAAALAASAPQAPQAARPWLRLVATRIAAELPKQRGPAATECLANCQETLRHLPPAPRSLAYRTSHLDAGAPASREANQSPYPASNAAPSNTTTMRIAPGLSRMETPPAANSGLPLPPLATAGNEPASIAPQASHPAAVANRSAQNSTVEADSGPLLPLPARQAPRLSPVPRSLENTPRHDDQPGTLLSHEANARDAAAVSASTKPFTGAEALRPFAAQHSSDVRIVAAAVAHLRQAGYSDFEIELGRQATSSNAAQRRRLAETLPRLSGVDPKTWLVWLSYDEDSQVRLTAVTWMITTGEPTLLARVRELAIHDPAEEVRRTAQRATVPAVRNR